MDNEVPYYTTHPNLGVAAVTYAPTAEKARTAFLDWLERNHLMKRSDRQLFRRGMIAKRLDDPNVQSDVVLHYGYEDATAVQPTQFPLPTEQPEELPAQLEEVELPRRQQEPTMPIQKVMLRGLRFHY